MIVLTDDELAAIAPTLAEYSRKLIRDGRQVPPHLKSALDKIFRGYQRASNATSRHVWPPGFDTIDRMMREHPTGAGRRSALVTTGDHGRVAA